MSLVKQLGLELWGGVECTVNRVGDTFLNQDRAGHRARAVEDLKRFSRLGLRTLRTALHWERFGEAGAQPWAEWDVLLGTMQSMAINPIVGLLHHGSGPRGTHLLDPEFPEKLAAYALQVAERYPWVTDYTPVNEPQTTGRFACMYGYWYPHERSMRSYVRALCNQVKGIVLAMRAIRTVQPHARLIHTEDGGETFATAGLEGYRQAREDRRWLGTDLLCGCVTREHALFGFLLEHGLTEQEVLWFGENVCPPAVIGLNYYVTSDRFLDDRLELYAWSGGGDTGDEPLVDVEAVRVRAEGIAGPGAMLRQAWARYGIPVAITEAHLGCEPKEQVRWLAEVWNAAGKARADGVDVRAVTVWALLGSYNWSNLCTRDTGVYEPGVFDVADGTVRETQLTEIVCRLANGLPLGAAARGLGWWHREGRLTIPPPGREAKRELELVGPR